MDALVGSARWMHLLDGRGANEARRCVTGVVNARNVYAGFSAGSAPMYPWPTPKASLARLQSQQRWQLWTAQCVCTSDPTAAERQRKASHLSVVLCRACKPDNKTRVDGCKRPVCSIETRKSLQRDVPVILPEQLLVCSRARDESAGDC
jgi:hypothetical protein